MVQLIILISGKRFSGKDFFAQMLQKALVTLLEEPVTIYHLADQLKLAYAKEHQASYELLVTDRSYKEQHRERMTAYYHALAEREPDAFCTALCRQLPAARGLAVVADLRHRFELACFRRLCGPVPLLTVRVEAADATRLRRGWQPAPVDADRTEVDLDGQPASAWDWCVANDADGPERLLAVLYEQMLPRIRAALRPREGNEVAT